MTNQAIARFQVEGMSCASCVGRVERALTGVPGVAGAAVNLANESVQVEYDAPIAPAALVEVLQDAGYPAVIEEVVLDVEDMSCASCVGRVERALQAGDGVVEASVNLAAETATVRYAVGGTTPAAIAALANAAGYPAQVKSAATSNKEDRKADEIRQLALRTSLAALLTLPVS